MSIRQNGKVIAGATQYHPDLFDWKWADHQLDDVQWLRADTFSWQSGAVYESAYQHLVDDVDGKTAQTETVAGITISFYLADDKHKITTDENAVMQIYAAIGEAWYYVLDTANQRFKLPRRSQGKIYHGQVIERLSSGVKWAEIYSDGWIRQGGTTDDCNFLVTMANTTYSALVSPRCMYAGERTVGIEVSGKSTTSISIAAGNFGANNRDWVVEGWSIRTSKEILLESEKYLYFYVGAFTQTALENTAGLNTSLFNAKADIDLTNAVSNISASAKGSITSWGAPDYSAAITTSTFPYTAPKDGYIIAFTGRDTDQYSNIKVNGIQVCLSIAYWTNLSYTVPVSKGDIISSDYATLNTVYFIPLKGAQ